MCLPIYESLQELTNHINGFYFENRPADAFRAASDASDLKVHTTNLTKEVEEKQLTNSTISNIIYMRGGN